jgi:hypothetical protein
VLPVQDAALLAPSAAIVIGCRCRCRRSSRVQPWPPGGAARPLGRAALVHATPEVPATALSDLLKFEVRRATPTRHAPRTQPRPRQPPPSRAPSRPQSDWQQGEEQDPTAKAKQIIDRATKVLEAAKTALQAPAADEGGEPASLAQVFAGGGAPPMTRWAPASSEPALTRNVLQGALDRMQGGGAWAKGGGGGGGGGGGLRGGRGSGRGALASSARDMPSWAEQLLGPDSFGGSSSSGGGGWDAPIGGGLSPLEDGLGLPLQLRAPAPAAAAAAASWDFAEFQPAALGLRMQSDVDAGAPPAVRSLARAAPLSAPPPPPAPAGALQSQLLHQRFRDSCNPVEPSSPPLAPPPERAASTTQLPPLQSMMDLTTAYKPPQRGAASGVQAEQAQGTRGRALPDGSGLLPDGTRCAGRLAPPAAPWGSPLQQQRQQQQLVRIASPTLLTPGLRPPLPADPPPPPLFPNPPCSWSKRSGEEFGPNGYWKRWTLLSGSSEDGKLQWEECWCVPAAGHGPRHLALTRARRGGAGRMCSCSWPCAGAGTPAGGGLRVLGCLGAWLVGGRGGAGRGGAGRGGAGDGAGRGTGRWDEVSGGGAVSAWRLPAAAGGRPATGLGCGSWAR